jgi:8-oxo-dGTP diphosphatase
MQANLVKVAAGIIINDAKVLIAKRSLAQDQGGLWEFPGGKIESSEHAEKALARELNEELGINVVESSHFKTLEFEYSDKRVQLHFFKVHRYNNFPFGKEGQLIQWVDIVKLKDYSFPQANQKIVELLVEQYG